MAETHTTSSIGARLRFAGAKRNRVPTHIAALDIDGDLLRVAFATRRGERVDFNRVLSAPLSFEANADRSDPAIMGASIRRALDTIGGKPGAVVMAVPRREAVLRTVSLPDIADERELASMVQLQVGRDLPYRKEDAVIDFEVRQPAIETVGPETKAAPDEKEDAASPAAGPKLEALVAAAQSDVVSFYQRACAAAGVKLAVLTFAPYANTRCLELCGNSAPEETVALVALRCGEVTVDVMRGGKLLFSRDAALAEEHHEDVEAPAADLAGAEAASADVVPIAQLTLVARITIEVVRSLHAFGGMTPGAPVARIIVSGGTGVENEVAEGLAKRFNFPATVLDLASAFKMSANAGEPMAIAASISAMGAAAAATDPSGISFDFLAPKRPAVQRDMRRIRMLAGAAAAVLLLIAMFGVRSYLVKKRVLVQKALQQEIATLQKSQALYRKTRAQAASIQDWKKESRSWLEHYAYLTSILPASEDIYITSLSIGSQGTIRMAVQARNGQVIARLDKQLRDAGYQVKPQAITPGSDRHGYNFKSSVELIVPPKLKIDLSKTKPPPARPADDVSLAPNAKLQGRVGAGDAPSVAVYGGTP